MITMQKIRIDGQTQWELSMGRVSWLVTALGLKLEASDISDFLVASDISDFLVASDITGKANLSWANFTGAVNVAWNVWIWTTSPWSKLDVVWDIKTSSKIISTGLEWIRQVNWDYGVFTRWDWTNYYLMSTANWDQYGSWSSNRPFTYSPATNTVTISPAKLNLGTRPTSPAWLSSWDIWRDWTTLKIVA